MDETGFPHNIFPPPKIVANKGAREGVERGDNVTAVACCSASVFFSPTFVILKRNRHRVLN